MKIHLKTVKEVYMFWKKIPEPRRNAGDGTYFFDGYAVKQLYNGPLSYYGGSCYSEQILKIEKKPRCKFI